MLKIKEDKSLYKEEFTKDDLRVIVTVNPYNSKKIKKSFLCGIKRMMEAINNYEKENSCILENIILKGEIKEPTFDKKIVFLHAKMIFKKAVEKVVE
jgi:hypothetical protein